MPPAKLGLVYSHTGLRRFIDAIGAARTRELFLLGSYIDAATALQWGLVTRVAAAEELEARALELAAELAGNAPLSQTGNKRVIAALLAAEGELARGRRAGADRAAPRVLRVGGHARGDARIRRAPSGALAGPLGRAPRAPAARAPPRAPPRASPRAGVHNPGPVRRAPYGFAMPPLITREEALRLGELEDHAQIEALIERAWQARVERFADSTDMCSLVNAKSGGCAEDCGFCAQSRFAEADTPMHAMMEPEQILEHARAAEAAGRAPLLHGHPGPGPLQARLREVPAGRAARRREDEPQALRLGRPHLRRARAQLREAGVQRVHHNVETASSYYDEVTTTVRYEGRLRTIRAVREAGLETCVGGILNLGETREQRVEMAFELAEIDPTSVPDQHAQPAPRHEVRRPRVHGPVGGRQVDRDLPADPARARCSGSAAVASRTSASCSSWPSRPASTG